MTTQQDILAGPPPPLGELVDTEAIREVCRTFSELYGIGVKVFDAEGTRIADVRASTADHCGYLFRVHSTQKMCTSLVSQLKTCDASQPVTLNCFSGLRYKIIPIEFEGSPYGRIIFGPFAPSDLAQPPASLAQYEGEGLSLSKLAEYQRTIPRANDDTVAKVLAHIHAIIDLIVHNSYKTYITNRMHIASISGAFGDLEKANAELRGANARLEELDRLKSNFIATVSHELRTPLTSVIGYSEMLIEGLAGPLNDEQRDYVGTILEKGESLLNLIGQVLDLSRIESGNVTMRRETTDVQEVLNLCVSDVTPQAMKKRLRINVDVTPDVVPIQVDRDKIRRVVTNLLGNAVKFTPQGGTIDILVSVNDDVPPGEARFDMFQPERNQYLQIEVRDSGIGIPEDKLERVFESFFQVDNSSTREYGGTGLGLSIVRNFIHAHGGRVSVSSSVGEGSAFVVKIPYVPHDEPPMVDGLRMSAPM